jgi:hypothetical protein
MKRGLYRPTFTAGLLYQGRMEANTGTKWLIYGA